MLTRIKLRLRTPCTSVVARLYATPSIPRSAPMAKLAEPEEQPVDDTPISRSNNKYIQEPRRIVTLPTMIPAGDRSDAAIMQQSLYPVAGVIDSRSMIDICLRRREHIPRAFQIFRQIIKDAQSRIKPFPEADLFANVVEGVASLSGEGEGAENWALRARHLVLQWESKHGTKQGQAALSNDGIKVYRGWLAGMITAKVAPTAIVSYLQAGSLKAAHLVSGMRPQIIDQVMEALTNVAKESRASNVERDLDSLRGRVQEERARASREVVPELAPILERHAPQSGSEAPESQPRFTIQTLRKALEPINSTLPAHIRQERLEASALEAATAELQRAAEMMNRRKDSLSGAMARQQLQAWMHEWYRELKNKLEVEIEQMQARVANEQATRQAKSSDPVNRYLIETSKVTGEDVFVMYLTVLPPAKLALVAILESMRAVGSSGIPDGFKAVRGMLNIGKAVETEYHAETIRAVSGTQSPDWARVLDSDSQKPSPRNIKTVWKQIGRNLEGESNGETSSQAREKYTAEQGTEWQSVWTPSWSQHAHVDIGGYLLNLVLETAKVTRTAQHPATGEKVSEEQPAFAHSYEFVKGHKLGVVRVNPVVASRLSSDYLVGLVHPKHLPMLVEPKPWTATDQGGYLIHKVEMMRHKDSQEQMSYLKSAVAQKHTEPILHALDVLSSTPWIINRKVFDVIQTSWNEGRAIAGIPASEANSNYDLPAKAPEVESDQRARFEWQTESKRIVLQQRKDHGERCKINYTLETARAFLHDTFYLPHNVDFRGRAYPIPPYLSPLGDDLNRGLLLFAKKKPLGETGLKWLRIHLANVYGYDKLSFEERARFAEDHEKEIFESADDPLNGSQWWLEAEDPWQCLATCFELTNALRSPDPKLFESNMPIHSDGTCNGMQHYAALGGDVRGARAVNLENGDRPADIYSRVAELVNKVVEQDQKKGVPQALAIHETLGRKIVKQTVMTTVYGVTFVGARDQIAKQLLARTDVERSQIFPVSSYLAATVLSCIGDLFSGAKDIQDWLVTAARMISRSIPEDRLLNAVLEPPASRSGKPGKSRLPKELMSAVIWTTPLGLPVVQPYRKSAMKQVMTSLQTVYVCDPHQPAEVSPTKQASAFPPNFIHSLDATHMFLTALRCNQNGLTFASVHDSYWTHACSVDAMSELIRDSFIQLHSQNLIGELREEFLDRYGNNYIPLENARSIHKGHLRRQVDDQRRRAEVRAVTADSGGVEEGTSQLVTAENELFGDDIALKAGNDNPAISEDEIAKILESGSAMITRIGSHRFVKLSDILPPCPPRGAFDVEKIRDSKYFFS